MKKIVILILSLFIVTGTQAFSQKKKGKDNTPKQVVVSDAERNLSQKFADGVRAFYSRDYASAEKDFRYVLSQNPASDASYFMLSKIKKESKDYAGAAYYLNEAAKINNKNEWYIVELAQIYDLLGDYKMSSKYWEEVCKLKPENEYYLFSLAESYLNQERFTDVIKAYDRIEQLVGFNVEVTEAKKNIWLYLNNVKNAVGEYDKLIKEYPYDITYYIQAGDIYATNNMPDKALTYYISAEKIDADNPQLQYSLYNYYKNKKDNQKAFESLLIAFKSSEWAIENKLPIMKYYLSMSFITNSESDMYKKQSGELIKAMTEAHPDAVESWATLAAFNIREKNYEVAREALEKAMQIDDSEYILWEDYMFVLFQLKDYHAITTHEKEMVELFPTNAVMYFRLGNAFQQEKEYQKAVQYLKQSLAFAYENNLLMQIYDILGDAYKGLNNNDEALKNWKTAKKKGLNSKDLDDKIKSLE